MSGLRRAGGGKLAWGVCHRTGMRYLLKDLVEDGENPGLLVHKNYYDPRHPQRDPIYLKDSTQLDRATGDIDRVHVIVYLGRLQDPFGDEVIRDGVCYPQTSRGKDTLVSFAADVSLTGVQCVPETGDVGFIFAADVSLTGVSCTPEIGSIVFDAKGFGAGGFGAGGFGT